MIPNETLLNREKCAHPSRLPSGCLQFPMVADVETKRLWSQTLGGAQGTLQKR